MTELDAALLRLPLFPLPGVVLLPGELMPLHVFEPRYRALVLACLDGDGLVGMATLRGSRHDGDPEAVPPALWPELGVGRIVRHQALDDGRSNILVRFVAAVRMEGELPTDEAFRRAACVARPRLSDDGYSPSAGLRVFAAQAVVALESSAAHEQLFSLAGRDWVDAMARLFLRDPAARRAYLRADVGAERVALVEEAVLSRLGSGASVTAEA